MKESNLQFTDWALNNKDGAICAIDDINAGFNHCVNLKLDLNEFIKEMSLWLIDMEVYYKDEKEFNALLIKRIKEVI